MKVVISCKIDNLIRNYCYNFLSYLYASNGWKRTMFETSKENYINSNVKENKIRIVISNTGKILLTCYCLTDIIDSLEYISEEFYNSRMKHYLVMDNETIIKTEFTATTYMSYYFENEEICKTDFGIISMKENKATLSYNSWENGQELIDVFKSALEDIGEDDIIKKRNDIKEKSEDTNIKEKSEDTNIKEKKRDEKIEQNIEKKDDNQVEKIILCYLFAYSLVRLTQYL